MPVQHRNREEVWRSSWGSEDYRTIEKHNDREDDVDEKRKKKADNKERGVEQLWKYREDPSTLAEERNSEDAATKREPVRNERQHEGRWKIWGGKWSDEWKEGEGERVGGMGNPRAGDRWAWVRWSGGGEAHRQRDDRMEWMKGEWERDGSRQTERSKDVGEERRRKALEN